MKLVQTIKNEILSLWSIKSNQRIVFDVALLFVATIAFHFFYWSSEAHNWIFGPWTEDVYNWFRNLSFNCSKILCLNFLPYDCDIKDTTYLFYYIDSWGRKIYNYSMEINIDCSAVKQLLQFALIMILCRGKYYKKFFYFWFGAIIIMICNIIRIYLITLVLTTHCEWFTSFHDWLARPMMYIVIFALWYIWIDKFANKSIKKQKP